MAKQPFRSLLSKEFAALIYKADWRFEAPAEIAKRALETGRATHEALQLPQHLAGKGIIRVPPVYPTPRLYFHGTSEVAAAQRFPEYGQ